MKSVNLHKKYRYLDVIYVHSLPHHHDVLVHGGVVLVPVVLTMAVKLLSRWVRESDVCMGCLKELH